MITLVHIKRASAFIQMIRIAEALGMPRDTLHKRIKRNGPELTPDEARRVETALREAGIKLIGSKSK